MKHTKTFKALLGLMMIISGSPKDLKAETTISIPVCIAATLGTVAGGIGLYKLYQWHTHEESNQELIMNGTTALHYHETTHRDMIEFFNGIFSMHANPYSKHTIATLPDSLLTLCADKVYSNYGNRYYVFSDLRDAQYALQTHEHKVNQRCIGLLQKNLNAQEQVEYNQLQAVALQLHSFIERLDCIVALSDYHGTYFEYYKKLKTLQQRHEYHITSLLPYVGTPLFEQQLHKIGFQKQGLFPIVDYANDLKYDLERLQQIQRSTSVRYQTLYETVTYLLHNLTTLYHAIMATETYRYQLTAYNAHRIEQERLRLERERLALERQQLHAQQSLAHAHERIADAYAWDTWNKWWHPSQWERPQKKEKVVVVTQPAPVIVQTPTQQQVQPQQPTITINNNPVVKVKPKIKQKPTVTQSPTITVENKTGKVEKKEEAPASSHDSYKPFTYDTYDLSDPELVMLNYIR